MNIKFTLKGKINKETKNACHESTKAFQELLLEVTRVRLLDFPGHIQKLGIGFTWFLSRFYIRRIGKGVITYHFPLLNYSEDVKLLNGALKKIKDP
jgi:hypothetical protein